MTASLWFDDLDLLPDEPVALTGDAFYFRAVAEGSDISNAEAVVASVTSQLFDGASHEVTGWESATLPLMVEVVSLTADGLALGEAQLVATCRRDSIRPLTLTPDGATVPSVWDVLVATSKHQYNDLDTYFRRRGFLLTLRCKPFARSETAVSLPGLAVGGAYSETVVATGASTTGWSTTSRYITRRNILLNPSFENGATVTPWARGAGTSAASVLTDAGAPDPTHVAKMTTTALSSGGRSYMNSSVMSVTPGQTYPIPLRIKAGHSAMTLAGGLIRWYDGSGAKIGSDDVTATALTTSSYATLALSKTAPAGAVLLQVYPFVQVNASVAAGQLWYLDATAVIDLKTVATSSFFDGDDAPSGGLTYYWGSSQGTSGVSIETSAASVSASGGSVFPHGSTTTVEPISVPGIGVDLTYTGTIDVTTHRYMRIKGASINAIELNGLPAQVVASGADVKYIRVPDAITTTVTSVRLDASHADWSVVVMRASEIATVSHPVSGTGRQLTRTVPLAGSMPAEATIEVTNNGNPLGDHLIVHTGTVAGGFLPLRALRTSGPTQTASASSISGFTSALVEHFDGVGADTFDIPVNQLGEATYLLTAYLTGSGLTAGSVYPFEWQASIVEDPTGTPVEHSVTTGSMLLPVSDTSYPASPLDLGLLNLPPTHAAVTGTNSAIVRVKIWSAAIGSHTWTLDEAWLADVDHGQVSTINLATAGLSGKVNTLEIVPATADRPQQQYLAYSGTVPNQTVREIIPAGWAQHRFDPAAGDAQVSVINTATTPGLSVAVEFFPRWDVYAAPIITDTEA